MDSFDLTKVLWKVDTNMRIFFLVKDYFEARYSCFEYKYNVLTGNVVSHEVLNINYFMIFHPKIIFGYYLDIFEKYVSKKPQLIWSNLTKMRFNE